MSPSRSDRRSGGNRGLRPSLGTHRRLFPRRRPIASIRILRRTLLPSRGTLRPSRNRQGILHRTLRGARIGRQFHDRVERAHAKIPHRRSNRSGVSKEGRGFRWRRIGCGDGNIPGQTPRNRKRKHLPLLGMLLRRHRRSDEPDRKTLHRRHGRIQLLLRPRPLHSHGFRSHRLHLHATQQNHHFQTVPRGHGTLPLRRRNEHRG
mmetsp:Transcript_18512/g.38533  ORF Transcript_18512/g.38533 Transcript_18512/m.38533 type:complete len:205 (+) Transcript_18512:1793-2407(+)